CDPAMGSGAFLVAACRLLAEEVVAAWDRADLTAAITEEHGDALLHARRLVAQRCLYGVDKNAAAVELAKLSLWLVTLSKELPFTFVDHALRHGDSLVGLDLEQIRGFHWAPKAQVETCHRALDDALEQALEHRDRILALADSEDAASQRDKQRLLEYAEQATERVRIIADVCIGAFFAKKKPKEREKERERRLELVGRLLAGHEELRDELAELAAQVRHQHAPFHWQLEFPEVFYQERCDPLDAGSVNRAAFMDVFIGNPPFMRGSGISSAHGNEYRDWLLAAEPEAVGGADLCAHFLLRAGGLLGLHGTLGMIATSTVSQGVTRSSGLSQLLRSGFRIYSATTKLPWIGGPNVAVALVHLAIGNPGTPNANVEPRLDGRNVATINSRLRGKPERSDAKRLYANRGLSFKGSVILGNGFIISPEARLRLVHQDSLNADVIRPYIGGKELNASPTQAHTDYVINFRDMTLEEAKAWPELLSIVRDLVKPERDRLRDNADGRRRRQFWWQFGRWTPGLDSALAGHPRCLALARVTKHLVFSFQSTDVVFTDMVYVFPLPNYASFAVLQSRVHLAWVRLQASMLADRSATERFVYGATECFETFPFPVVDPRAIVPELESVGEVFYSTRAAYLRDSGQGLTEAYNALLDHRGWEASVERLRCLHEQMDRAVLDAYGWSDIEVPPYCPRTDDDYAAVQEFEDEVVDRLYVLNAERAQDEERRGLRENEGSRQGKKKSVGRRQNKSPDGEEQGKLF
ncbi:MAG: hypothetical protein KC619_00465, partial [Myxococcales bacterium]|nr:hypothetical protein [Myxococcales bacterium]